MKPSGTTLGKADVVGQAHCTEGSRGPQGKGPAKVTQPLRDRCRAEGIDNSDYQLVEYLLYTVLKFLVCIS